MSALTRCRSKDTREECWHVYYGDVQVGTIAIRTGIPHDQARWGWRCGFYPGSNPGECTAGTAATFDQARADFESAWQVFSARRTEFDYQAWRDQRDWTAEVSSLRPRRAHANGLESAWAPRYWLIRNSESIEGVFV
jgi:hypothetical protein